MTARQEVDVRSLRSHLRTWKALISRVELSKAQAGLVVAMAVLASLSEFLSIALIQPVLVLFSGQELSTELAGVQRMLLHWLEQLGSVSRILVLVGLIVLLQVFREALMFLAELVAIRIRTAFELRTRELVYKKCLAMPLDVYKRTPSGDFHNIISAFPRSAAGYVFSALSFIPQLFMLSVYLVLMWMMEGRLLLVVAVVVLVVFSGMRFAYIRQTKYGRLMRDALADISSRATELVEALPVIRAFNQEGRMQSIYGDVARRYLDASAASSIINAAIGPLQRILTFLTILTCMAAFFFWSGTEEREFLTTLIVFLVILGRLNGPLSAINLQRAGLAQLLPFVEKLKEFLDRYEQDESGGQPPPTPLREIALERVSFAYTSGEIVLDDVSLSVERGEFVALVGPSGAGKSTVASLVCGFESPLFGRVTVNGEDLAAIDRRAWRRKVSVVPQSPYMFDLSIGENIRFSRPEASDEAVREAANAANAVDFIDSFPEGFETPTGEGGDLLSGGQVQRLALARALLTRPELLILDEATSAQDSTSEARIRETLESLRGRVTCIVIAHRLSTIRNADRIIVLDRGRIVESGTHDALSQAGGLFSQLLSESHSNSETATEAWSQPEGEQLDEHTPKVRVAGPATGRTF